MCRRDAQRSPPGDSDPSFKFFRGRAANAGASQGGRQPTRGPFTTAFWFRDASYILSLACANLIKRARRVPGYLPDRQNGPANFQSQQANGLNGRSSDFHRTEAQRRAASGVWIDPIRKGAAWIFTSG